MAEAAQETYLAVLKAAYDYDPQPGAEEELKVQENQLVFLLERTDEDWWRVKIKTDTQEEDGASGLVPAAYLEPADHISVVKALYDYDAAQPSELSVKEDEILYVYGKDDDWLLVGNKTDGKAGYVPGNYVEETDSDQVAAPAAAPSIANIVIPPSPELPPRVVSVYVDPADRVAAAPKAPADAIQTWVVSEVDKKSKKKKGTLGIGNGSVFFASESDKTPVRKWDTTDISDARVEKSKHIHIEVGGATPTSLHFHSGSKDVAEAIFAKLQSSRALSVPASAVDSGPGEDIERPRSSAQKAVHFDNSEPAIIPPREPSEDGEEEVEPEVGPAHEVEDDEASPPSAQAGIGEAAVVLYDFMADGEDELTVQEGEHLVVIERDGDEWWKCRNAAGDEGVVPASYVQLSDADTPSASTATYNEDPAAIAAARAAKEADEHEANNRLAEERAAKQEREDKKKEAAQRDKAAAAAAEAERKHREQERERQKEKERAAAEDEEINRRKSHESTSPQSASRNKSSPNGDASSSGRSSSDARRGPPPTEQTRIWHDRTGQFRVEAALLGFTNGKLRLHKVNGVVIEVPSEKMSPEDLRYVEKTLKKASPPRRSEDDDEPLELRRRSLVPDAATRTLPRQAPKKPTVDWFEFFLNAGCDIDDCTRYAQAFERDKIDESILPDITESTMRSLGLREGDIIRVKKAIEQRQPAKSADSKSSEQIRRDEELARQSQAEESGTPRSRGPAPNLFAGPNGVLKNNTVRRGRPQPSNRVPPAIVDIHSISTASDQIQRTSSPQVAKPATPKPTSPDMPPRSNSAAAVVSGFDDDAWTNRPSSTKPLAPTPPALAQRAPSAPPAPPAPLAPLAPPTPPVVAVQVPLVPAGQSPPAAAPSTGTPNHANATESDIFEQLARLSQLRVQSPAAAPIARSPAIATPPISYHSGLGMGQSTIPMGQHLQNQQTGYLPPPQLNQQTGYLPPPQQQGPRGPLAPVPVNQSLLQPLIPTSTGFNNFIPVRPPSTSTPFQPSPSPSFLPTQPTGYTGPSQNLLPQQTGFLGGPQPLLQQTTGFSNQGPLLSQPTGYSSGNFGGQLGGLGPPPSFQNNSGFGQIQSNPTGFNPGFGQSPFANGVAPQPPSQPSAPNTNPANIFAQMKSGTFANDSASNPQPEDKYNALRTNFTPLAAQPTGWGYGNTNGYQGGFGR